MAAARSFAMSHQTSRRFFLGAATAAAATRVWGANDKINVGHRRTRRPRDQSPEHLLEAARGRVVAALRYRPGGPREGAGDPAEEHQGKGQGIRRHAPGLRRSSVEAVSIATPNHWHALAAIWACRRARTSTAKSRPLQIHEGQRMLQVARETKRMVQIGSQHRSTPFKMRAMERAAGGHDRQGLHG